MATPATAQPDTLILYASLPQFLQDNDAAGGYQFLSWLDGFISEGGGSSSLTYDYDDVGDVNDNDVGDVESDEFPIPAMIGLQAIDDIVRDTPYNPGWSAILDINRCPTYALPWLGQFVGVRLNEIATAHNTTNLDQRLRTIIQNENAFARGTASTIETAANAYMKPGYFVTLQERTSFIASTFAADPYAITITFTSADVANLTYGQLFSDYSDYAAVLSALPYYSDFGQGIPNLEAAALAAAPAGLFCYFNAV